MAMGVVYSFYVKSIENHARAFLTLNILAIGRVLYEGLTSKQAGQGQLIQIYLFKNVANCFRSQLKLAMI